MPDWTSGCPVRLRQWRNAQPDVISPVLPDDVRLIERSPAEGGGLECCPEHHEDGVIVHFHGGGFVVGSPHTHRCVGAWISHVTRRKVWLCPWPLAPEHVLPDQIAATVDILQLARALYGSRLYLSGDSAGAMVAIWAWLKADKEMKSCIAGIQLFYGFFGLIPDQGDESLGLGPISVRSMMDRLDPNGWIARNPSFLPLKTQDLLPENTLIVAAGDDPLKENSIQLGRKNPKAHLRILQQLPHGFLSVDNQQAKSLRHVGEAIECIFWKNYDQ